MPEVFVDTSPIQYLHQSGLLHLLPALYTRLIVPAGVLAELEVGRKLGVALPDLASLSWVEVRTVTNQPWLRFSPDLGSGEKEVLALALESIDRLAILDDALARRQADLLAIPSTGTIGVLLKSKQVGLVPRVGPIFQRLVGLGFRLSSATQSAALELADEKA